MSGSSAAAAVDDDDGGAGNSDGLLHVRGASAPGRGRRGLGSCRREPSNAVGYDSIERRAVRAPGTRRNYVRPSVRLVSVHVRARRPSAPRSPRERARLLSTSTWLGVAWGVVRSVHAAYAPHRIAPHRIQDSRRAAVIAAVGVGESPWRAGRAGVRAGARGCDGERTRSRSRREAHGVLGDCLQLLACVHGRERAGAGRGRGTRGGARGGRLAGRMRVIRWMLLLLLCVSRAGRWRAKDSGDGTAWKGGAVQCGACVRAGIARAGTGFVGGTM